MRQDACRKKWDAHPVKFLPPLERAWKTPQFVLIGVGQNLVVLRPLQKIYMPTHQTDNSSAGVPFGKPFRWRTGCVIKMTRIRFIRFPKQHVRGAKICDSVGDAIFAPGPIEGIATFDNAATHHIKTSKKSSLTKGHDSSNNSESA